MNAELGRKVLNHIEAHRDQFDMSDWAYKNECGTVACLAGWTMLLSGYRLDEDDVFYRPDGSMVNGEGDEAQELLGLTDAQRHRPHAEDSDIDGLFTLSDERAITEFRALVEASEQ